MMLLRIACASAVLLSIAAASWWLYAVAVRQDWVGLAMGVGAVMYALAWGAGVVAIDRWLGQVHARPSTSR